MDKQHVLWYVLRIADGHEKANPCVRRGRKATGLDYFETAGLPEDFISEFPAFFLCILR